MFDSTKEDLKDILRKVDEGKLQLPDFQRDYVWGDDDVQSLIASIAKGFPVGALLTLETGGQVAFKPRTLSGVERVNPGPEELLLDGQQRMTSLFQSMYCKRPIKTRTQKKVEIEARFYYLDIAKAASDAANIEEAIVGVPADRIVRTNFGRDVVLDLSTAASEYEHDLFPLNQVFDHTDWHFGWRGHWKDRNPDRFELERGFFKGVVDTIQRYKMPIGGRPDELKHSTWVNARDAYRMKREHGIIRNRLRDLLLDAQLKVSRDGSRDVVVGEPANPDFEFEVKPSTDSQSVFTAVGQLLLHGATFPTKRRVVVLPEGLDSQRIQAIQSLNIELVLFQMGNGRIMFKGLNRLIPRASCTAPLRKR